MSYGGGIDLLLDLITTHASSFGVLGGLRGLYNEYRTLNQVKANGNFNAVTRFNYRHNHSKYSIGISIPLIQRSVKIASNSGTYTNSIVLNEGASHFKAFFNYGWVF
ncbi:outer membrane protein HomC [Helicobacter acinonychis]|uniref:Hom-family outer membrane protein 4 n=3 Tax=Helicobacter acinonychis TaxID=212 RepID=Q17WH7_HELAH|nr:hom-family outer membrane protein fragment 4 [Helicobacter acinonychis str. Sheeba]SFZ70575.1 OMP1228 [Helicobacter acinonychis]SFZ70904.1 OMP712 [Helicobacter acinonychis]STP04546.1 outer membrane protein HomC [Helicobacter acinonychis]